jgi:pseudomonalisin
MPTPNQPLRAVVAAAAIAAVLAIVSPSAASATPALAPLAGSLTPVVPGTSDGGTSATGDTGAAPTDPSTPVTLTVVLTPDDRSALRDLIARTASQSASSTAEQLDAAAPDSDTAPDVRSALTAAGFTVTQSDQWDLAATGTVGLAEALFDVTVVGSGDTMHPTSSITMPASFGGQVSEVLGLDLRPVVMPSSTTTSPPTAADLASAYAAPASATAGTGTVIATVQFSGWNSSDLSTYAAHLGRKIVGLTQVAVDGASTTPTKGDTSGPLEVSLDQEMVLTAAPGARQRIYFAPETLQGMYDAWSRIAADAKNGAITAVSTSWGMCESELSANARGVLEDAIDRVVASGATVFAASGDSGARCAVSSTSASVSVTYPASSPAVVGVGGTSLTRSGSGWSESVWNSSQGSSGGGVSRAIARPSYQSSIGISGSTRAVPDIAADADPNTGPAVYIASAGGWVLGGGTSLSAPLQASQFASTLSARGCGRGVGDIHASLYAHTGAFRDITSGSNGSVSARVGYDAVTGLGTPRWSALSAVLPKSSLCSSSASATSPSGTASSGTAATSASAPGVAASSTLITGPTKIVAGTTLRSPSGQYRLTMQSNGDAVVSGNGRALWSTGTSAYPGATLRLESSGYMHVVDRSGQVRWSVGRAGSGALSLRLTNTGDLVLSRGGAAIWHDGAPGADTLTPSATLTAGQAVWDRSGKVELAMQSDGNLVIYRSGKAVWSTKTSNRKGAHMAYGADGVLRVIDTSGVVRYASPTKQWGASGSRFTLGSDGRLTLRKNGKGVWSV